VKLRSYAILLITSKVLDARRSFDKLRINSSDDRGVWSNTAQAFRQAQGRMRGAIEGNAADDALMVDQGSTNDLARRTQKWYFGSQKCSKRSTAFDYEQVGPPLKAH